MELQVQSIVKPLRLSSWEKTIIIVISRCREGDCFKVVSQNAVSNMVKMEHFIIYTVLYYLTTEKMSSNCIFKEVHSKSSSTIFVKNYILNDLQFCHSTSS